MIRAYSEQMLDKIIHEIDRREKKQFTLDGYWMVLLKMDFKILWLMQYCLCAVDVCFVGKGTPH